MIDGREVQLTLRDTDEQALLVRLGQLLSQFSVSQRTGTVKTDTISTPTGSEKLCPLHHQPMRERTGRYGKFYSHKTAQGWCQGRLITSPAFLLCSAVFHPISVGSGVLLTI